MQTQQHTTPNGAQLAFTFAPATFREAILAAWNTGASIPDNRTLKREFAAFIGRPADDLTPADLKRAQEEFEAAMALRVRDLARPVHGQRFTPNTALFAALVRLYDEQPTLNVRTATSARQQAYSTPVPLAYLANILAHVGPKTTVYEPTAGTGLLLPLADPRLTLANELDCDRADILHALGFHVLQLDARNALASDALLRSAHALEPRFPADTSEPARLFDAVLANPPFGAIEEYRHDGFRIQRLEHQISIDALAAMKPDGHAVLILGANKRPGVTDAERPFFNWLWSHYRIAASFELDGSLYARQGAEWPIRVLAIAGRAPTGQWFPADAHVPRYSTWPEVYEAVAHVLGIVAGTATPLPTQTPAPTVARPAPIPAPVATPAPAPASSPAPAPATTQTSTGTHRLQRPYLPHSRAPGNDVLAPTNLADAMHRALTRLETELAADGSGQARTLDDYAADKLGWTVPQLHARLMHSQVDAVAAAIREIDRKGALIIGDATGTGKGRQGAALIAYAVRAGLVPVFFSRDPVHFSVLYRDLCDIGAPNLKPFVVNAGAEIRAQDQTLLHKQSPDQTRQGLRKLHAGALPSGTHFVACTYSQIQQDNRQQAALRALVHQAPTVFVLDESHNAAGDSERGRFLLQLLPHAHAAIYLSATFAKRPENMALYARTNMMRANPDPAALIGAIEAGGLPLQQVLSHGLATDGQLFRRERSFAGVTFHTHIATDTRAQDEHTSDAVTAALRAIVHADAAFHSRVSEAERAIKQSQRQGQPGAYIQIGSTTPRTMAATLSHATFATQAHNAIRQFLYSLKADQVATLAIAAYKRGQKPVIAVDGTMGSFLDDVAESQGLEHGQIIHDFDYRTILRRAMRRTLRINLTTPQGDARSELLNVDDLPEELAAPYTHAAACIDAVHVNAPASPIDWIRYRLEAEGITVAEITGRATRMRYLDGGSAVYELRTPQDMARFAALSRFNNGGADAIILNTAGAEGIDLHSGANFRDQRQRHMFVAQASLDINAFIQMLGRVHRTGQVSVPDYTFVVSDLPAEKRPSAVLQRKLKSLSANTTSNTQSNVEQQAVDMLNRYGDHLAEQFLRANPHIKRHIPISIPEKRERDRQSYPETDMMRRATGYLALLPVALQHEFYDSLETDYRALLAYLTAAGENRLEARTLDYDARTLTTEELAPGSTDGSVFDAPVYLHTLDIKRQGRPPKPQEVHARIVDTLQGKPADRCTAGFLNPLRSAFQRYKRHLSNPEFQAKARAVADETTASITERFPIGHGHTLSFRDPSGNVRVHHAIVTRLHTNWDPSKSGNPLAPSRIVVELAVNSGIRMLRLPLTQLADAVLDAGEPNPPIDRWFAVPAQERQRARVLTGNLLRAYQLLQSVEVPNPEIIHYTDHSGAIHQAIRVPSDVRIEAAQGSVALKTPDEALALLAHSTQRNPLAVMVKGTAGPELTLDCPNAGSYRLTVSTNSLHGGCWATDAELNGLLPEQFAWTHGTKRASVTLPDDDTARAVIAYLMTKTPVLGSGLQSDLNAALKA